MLVILIAVAMLFVAKVRLPVKPVPAAINVSELIAIVIAPAPASVIKPMAVPIGKATLELAGIVQVLAVVSAAGWNMCLPESESCNV